MTEDLPTMYTVGVLGGLGPEATLDFFAKVLAKTPAHSDQEHLHLLIDNNPQVPNRNDAIARQGESPGPILARMAAGLERAGADFVVMACNAAHAFQADIEAALYVPFISIIEETTAATLETKARRVGVLAADACRQAGLYQDSFASHEVETLWLSASDQAEFMALLYRIKAGERNAMLSSAMQRLAQSLCTAGAEVIVAGCTEVPLVLSGDALPCLLISSTDVLAEATVAYARKQRPLPKLDLQV